MDYRSVQKIKNLSINCDCYDPQDDFHYDRDQLFQRQFGSFKKEFLGMGMEKNYEVSMFNCTNQQSQKIFELIFKNPKPNMVSLKFGCQNIPTNEWKMFTATKWKNLQTIQIRNKMDDQCCELFSQCEIPKLKELGLFSCGLSVVGFSHIFQCKLQKLSKLSINYDNLSKQSVRNLLKTEWNNLIKINLNCGLQYEGLKILIKCQWQELNQLSLFIGDCSIDSLYCGDWPLLIKIHLHDGTMTHLRTMSLGKLNLKGATIFHVLFQTVPRVMNRKMQIN